MSDNVGLTFVHNVSVSYSLPIFAEITSLIRMSLPYWQDVNVVAVNKEKPRSSFVSYIDKSSALTFDYSKSKYYSLLNGTWKFYFTNSDKSLPNDITNTKPDVSQWNDINVPGNWECQGYGDAIYTNIVYDFMPDNPSPPKLPNNVPIGIYYREFDIPEDWINRDIYFHVAGAKTGLYVYINGNEVGYSEDSKNPAEFLVNKYVHPGINTVTLKIYKYTTGSYLEDQDMWRLGGIERDVFIWSQPKAHIRDFSIVSTLDDNYSNGIFRITSIITNHHSEEQTFTIHYELIDKEQHVVSQNSSNVHLHSYEEAEVEFNSEIKNVLQWSSEAPNLYHLTISITNNDEVIEVVPFRVGFRREEFSTVSFNGKSYPVLLFNGKQVLYKGVNIHEHNMHTGHYVTDEIRLRDIELLKQNNFNALRFSHYPQDHLLYELCDIYGIHVVSEANIESHGMGFDAEHTLGNKKEWDQSHFDRTINMYERTKNYACVTFFSLGNEAGNGKVFYQTYKWIKEREAKGNNRPVNYEPAQFEDNTDMYVPMYHNSDKMEQLGNEGTSKPVVLCEYSHAMGNSNGNFNLLWKIFYKYPNLQGGFIWDWVDQGILETGKDGRKYYTYGGDYGKGLPSDGNFNINGVVDPDRTPHPAMAEIKYSQQNISFEALDLKKGKFRILNRFYFTNLDNYDVYYSLKANEKIIKCDSLHIDLQPQQFTDIEISLNDIQSQIATEYFIDFYVKTNVDLPMISKGFEVAHDQFKLQFEPISKKEANENGPELSILRNEQSITISSSKVYFNFDIFKGYVTSYKVDNLEFIDKEFGFRPNFWRSPTDNDYGYFGPHNEQVWKKGSKEFVPENIDCDKKKNNVLLNIKYNIAQTHIYDVTYNVYPSGIVNVKCILSKYSNTQTPNIPRIGIRFHAPQEMNVVEYFGRGPCENYWDRKSGSMIGHYKSTAEELYHPYIRPQENGHHTDTRWLALETTAGNGLLICANDVIEFNALKNTCEDFDSEDQVDLPRQWLNYNKSFDSPQNEELAKNKVKRQHHIDDVVLRDFVEVCIDHKQKGVAGFDSWGDKPLPEHTLTSDKTYEYGFTIIPINDPSEISGKLVYNYE